MTKLTILASFALLASLAPAQNTNFLAWDEEFAEWGDWAVQSFRLSGTRSFRLRAASDYKVDAVVIPAGELADFQDGNDFFGYGFDDSFGNKTVTLPPGNYYLAVRNQVDGANYARVELDHLMTPAHAPGWKFGYWGAYDTDYLEPDYKYWALFSKTSDQRLFVDGANVGLQTYVIPESQLSRFRTGRTFSYYSLYSRSTTDMPGFYELKLPTGRYALTFYNRWDDYIAFTYEFERWVRSSMAPSSMATETAIPVGKKLASAGTVSRSVVEPSGTIGNTMRSHPGIPNVGLAALGLKPESPKPWITDPRRPKPAGDGHILSRLFPSTPSPMAGR